VLYNGSDWIVQTSWQFDFLLTDTVTYDGTDQKTAILAALDAHKGEKILWPKASGDWQCSLMTLDSDNDGTEIYFADGVGVDVPAGGSGFVVISGTDIKLQSVRKYGATITANNSNNTHLINFNGAQNCHIDGFTLVGQGAGAGERDCVYFGGGSANCSATNCDASDASRNIMSIVEADRCRIAHCKIHGANSGVLGYGVDIEANSIDAINTDCVVEYCEVYDNASNGLGVVFGQRATFRGNVCYNNASNIVVSATGPVFTAPADVNHPNQNRWISDFGADGIITCENIGDVPQGSKFIFGNSGVKDLPDEIEGVATYWFIAEILGQDKCRISRFNGQDTLTTLTTPAGGYGTLATDSTSDYKMNCYIDELSSGHIVEDNDCTDPNGTNKACIEVNLASNVIVRRNTVGINDEGQRGIKCQHTRNLTVTRNVVTDTNLSNQGIEVQAIAGDLEVTYNTVNATDLYAFNIGGCGQGLIAHNDAVSHTGRGYYVANSVGTYFLNNSADSGNRGIEILNTCENIVVELCDFEGAGGSNANSLLDNGTNTTQSQNTLYDGTVQSQTAIEPWDKFETLSPYDFGAGSGNVSKDTQAIQAFFDYCALNRVAHANMDGDWTIDKEIVVGPSSGTNATKRFIGQLQLTKGTGFTDNNLVRMQNCSSVHFDNFRLTGGGTTWSSRGVVNGLFLETNNGRVKIDRLIVSGVQYAGLNVANANSVAQFGNVKPSDCGSGTSVANTTLQSTWTFNGGSSAAANSGSSNSVNQHTTLDVATDLPTWIETGTAGDDATTYATVNDSPILCRINGNWHYITAADRVAGTINVYPWVLSTETPGTLDYVFGAGVMLQGSDCNDHDFEGVDAIRCSQGLACASLYIPVARRVVTQFCGAAISFGRVPSGASLGGLIQGLYCENNYSDALMICRQSLTTSNYTVIQGDWAFDLAEMDSVAYPLTSGDVRDLYGTSWSRTRLTIGSHDYIYQKRKYNRINSGSSTTVYCDGRPTLTWYEGGDITVNLECDIDAHNITGQDSRHVVVTGAGGNGQPTGTITLQASATPHPSGTVNGGATAVYSGLSAPLNVIVRYAPATDDFIVTQI
jgi:hypothetical protein